MTPTITLFLANGRVLRIYNLNRLWIEKDWLGGYCLLYSDDYWKQRIIYFDHNYSALENCKKEILQAYWNGEDNLIVR